MRADVAQNRHNPAETLKRLAEDPDQSVQKAGRWAGWVRWMREIKKTEHILGVCKLFIVPHATSQNLLKATLT